MKIRKTNNSSLRGKRRERSWRRRGTRVWGKKKKTNNSIRTRERRKNKRNSSHKINTNNNSSNNKNNSNKRVVQRGWGGGGDGSGEVVVVPSRLGFPWSLSAPSPFPSLAPRTSHFLLCISAPLARLRREICTLSNYRLSWSRPLASCLRPLLTLLAASVQDREAPRGITEGQARVNCVVWR